MVSVAEGIEAPDQQEKAAAEGCAEMQGGLFGRPLKTDDLRVFLSSRRLAKGRSTPSAA
jgi:EAL domain-containing protein (putative c-di-GMP-specific phosphodiesterase class I)